jgi:hypothetical protein
MLPIVWDYTHPGTGEVVRNVEGLCRSVLDRVAAKLPRPLEPADYAESLAFLLAEVVVLAETKYDPTRSSGLGGFLSARLGFRLIDYWRRSYGQHGEKRVVDVAAGEQAQRDSGAQDLDWTGYEPVDERLEACVEDYVIGRLELLEILRQRAAEDDEMAIKPSRRRARRLAARAPA